jgi:hypothetical protein
VYQTLVVAPVFAVVWFMRGIALMFGAILGGVIGFDRLFGHQAVFDALRLEWIATGTAFEPLIDGLGMLLMTGLMGATLWLLHTRILPYWTVAALVCLLTAGAPVTAGEARRIARYLGAQTVRSPRLRVPGAIWRHRLGERRAILFGLANGAAATRGLPPPFPSPDDLARRAAAGGSSRRPGSPPPRDLPDFDNPEAAKVGGALRTLGLTAPPAEFAPIRRAWKSLIQANHPDRHAQASPEVQRLAAQRTAEINAAYRVLEQAYAARAETAHA